MKWLYALAAICAVILMASPNVEASHGERYPRCAEDDALLIGVGDFSHGRFERYECLHPENLTEAAKSDSDIGPGVAEAICEHQRFWKRQHGIGPLVEETCAH